MAGVCGGMRTPKFAFLGGFSWPLGNWGIFRGILKVGYNRAFSVKYSKNMRISASQNMLRPIFQVIYHKIYTYIAEMYFWGILGDFLTKIWNFRGFFQFELATLGPGTPYRGCIRGRGGSAC
jgi:hypothetical protein